jgi:CRP/FNR family transcriptional regulator
MTGVLPCAPPGSRPPRRGQFQVETYLRIARSLRRISQLMNVLSDDELDRLIPMLTERSFASRQLLFSAGEVPERVFLILKGRVKLYHSSSNGKEVIIDIAGKGDLVGDMAILEGSDHTVYARALEETVVVTICWDDLFYLVQHSPRLAFTMAEIMARRLAGVQRTLMNLVSKPVSGRLADSLLDRLHGDDLRLGLTHEELGQTIGTSRETVTALLSRFVTLGAIEPTSDGYRVTNEELLREIATGAVTVSPRHPARGQPTAPKS